MASGIFAGMEDFGLGEMSTKDIFRDKEAEAKKAKDFAKADAIREELLSKGVAIKDTREGVVWELV